MFQSLDLLKNITSLYFWCKIQVLLYIQMKSASHSSIITALKFTCCSSLSQRSTDRPTEESRWLAVLERVAERLSRSSFVDLGTGTLWSSRYLLYFLMWLACVVSHLCREHNSSGFQFFLSSTTFGHKSCILARFLSIIST